MRPLLLILICCASLDAQEPGRVIDDPDLGFTLRIPPGWKFVPEEEIDAYEASINSSRTLDVNTLVYALSRTGALERTYVLIWDSPMSFSGLDLKKAFGDIMYVMDAREVSEQLGRDVGPIEAAAAHSNLIVDEKRHATFVCLANVNEHGQQVTTILATLLGHHRSILVALHFEEDAQDVVETTTVLVNGFEWHDGFAHVPPESLAKRLLIAALIGAGGASLVVIVRHFIRRRTARHSP